MARVLLVEDNDLVREVLGLAIENSGHEVIDACDGRAALKKLSRNAADILVADLFMPEMDGLELIRELRKRNAPLKVIAISGGNPGSSTDYLKAATAFGADCTLAKPFKTSELLDSIAALVAGRSPAAAHADFPAL